VPSDRLDKRNVLPAVKLLLPDGEIRVMCFGQHEASSVSWHGSGHSGARDKEEVERVTAGFGL